MPIVVFNMRGGAKVLSEKKGEIAQESVNTLLYFLEFDRLANVNTKRSKMMR